MAPSRSTGSLGHLSASNKSSAVPSAASSVAPSVFSVESDDTSVRVTRSRKKVAVSPNPTSSRNGKISESASTAPSPENDDSTPPSSYTNTPSAVAYAGGGLSKLPGFQPASSLLRLEIDLPERKADNSVPLASDSMKALSKSKFALNSKRKRSGEISDSDAEDDELVNDSALSRDARLARQLQKEEDSLHQPSSSASRALSSSFTTRSSAAVPVRSSSRLKREFKTSPGPEAKPDISQDSIVISSDSDGFGSVPLAQSRKRRQIRRPSAKEVKAELAPIDLLDGTKDVDTVDLSVIDDKAQDTSDLDILSPLSNMSDWGSDDDGDAEGDILVSTLDMNRLGTRRQYRDYRNKQRAKGDRGRLEDRHPILKSMWKELEEKPVVQPPRADQPTTISRNLKPFQLDGLAWMMAMEKTTWKGGLLGDEMGLGKTIQAVSLIMSDYPAKKPSLVLVPPVALMQWMTEIQAYTDGCLNTLVYHGTNAKTKGMTIKDIKRYDVIIMSYNSLESMYRKQEKGFRRKDGIYKEKSMIHQTHFHRVILDEAHCIKTRSTMTAKACFALKVDYRWCLTGTPLQNRIGEFFSLLRFLVIEPFANYVCRDCKCSKLEWSMDDDNMCTVCKHRGMRHVSVFNQELLNPIQRYGNFGPGKDAFKKLRILTDRVMLRRLKRDHTDSMELPVKEINVDRQFFSEVETDFANSIMTNTQRKFTTYVENGVMLNNYANIFGLIMQMRQVADHPDLILKKNSEGSQNVLVCCICDEPAEEAIRSKCKHDFCRECAKNYLHATEQPDCPRCHIPLSIDLEQAEMEQDELMVKKSSIINRIRMENWTSSSKIELLVHNLYRLRSDKVMHKSIIFSQFTTMLQLIEWRLRRAGITTVMLDGSMTPAQRQASIEYFKSNVDVECFLVSLKAGGVALNLTEASRVFIVDPWWNPAAEWQSADRCHRIGQTRPCVVTRLCIEDSVESRMVLLQEKKTRMINSTINSDDSAMESLTPEDLQFLFRGN